MQDLAIALDNRLGALAEMGELLGHPGISIEGGGAWVVKGEGRAHLLLSDGEAAGIRVFSVRDVIMQRLSQEGRDSSAS